MRQVVGGGADTACDVYSTHTMEDLRTAVTLLLVAVATLGAAQEPAATEETLRSGFKPGDILDSTDHNEVERALQDLSSLPSIIYGRRVAIGLSLVAGALENPKYKLNDGTPWSTIPDTLNAGQTSLLLFTKYYVGIKGAFGVVTYNIKDSAFMVAVMFSVPFDRIVYENTFNFKVFSKTTPVNAAMVDHMYNYAGAWPAGGYQDREEFGVKIRGTMSTSQYSHLILTVDTSGLNVRLPPARHADCEFRATSLGYRCWRECTPTGWCWTNTACDKMADCDGNTLFCDDSCNAP